MLVYFEYREWREKRRRSFLIQRHQWKNLSRYDTNDITVWLRPEELAKNGWELDQTNATQVKPAH